MLTRKLGVFYLFCSADRIIMNLGHWKSSYLEGYSFSHPPCIYSLPSLSLRLWSSSSARIKSRSGVDDNSISVIHTKRNTPKSERGGTVVSMQHNTATRRNASPSVLAGAFCLRSDSADTRFEEVRGGRPAPPLFFPHNASAESFRHFNGIITLLKHPKTAVAASILSTQSQRRWCFQSVFKAPLLFSFPHKKKKNTKQRTGRYPGRYRPIQM